MNVKKIERLGEEHRALKDFHSACVHNNDVELVAKKTAYETVLNRSTTKSIIVAVRVAVAKRLNAIEVEIKKEAGK